MVKKLKNKRKLTAIGLMSGTSLDGLDICLAEITNISGQIKSNLLKFSSMEYSERFKEYLLTLANARTPGLCEANFRISREWSSLIKDFINENNIENIDLIGSHGQTVWHIHGNSTLQIGEPSVLAYELETPVIADFRVMDVAAGGSGAPLVPFIDYLWFKEFGKSFLLLNIGGIANFSIIPKNCKSVDDIYALDTGPGNGLIDAAISLATCGTEKFDNNGQWAERGKINTEILSDLLSHDYFSTPMPKSTGKEVFGENFVKKLIKKYQVESTEDYENLIATLTRFTAESIYFGYKDFFSEKYPLDEIVVSGGGALNPMIMKHLQDCFEGMQFSDAARYNIDAESKEAHAFAVLAALRVWEIPANVPNVTGAQKSVLLGKIIY